MKKNIISIEKDLCIGCGLCVSACHQGALQIVDGKATLISEDYCDGLGRCLPNCPTGALTIVEKEVDINALKTPKSQCPSANMSVLKPKTTEKSSNPSQLGQWPCQIQLVPVNAPYFQNADLLIAADCTAFANANIHSEYMQGKITLIGCPKLDSVDYSEKLTDIITYNDINSVTVVRMSVPCCGGIERATKMAVDSSGKSLDVKVVTISPDGSIV